MRTGLLRGPLLLLLYQAVPLGAARDSVGRYRMTFGFGAGQWENEQFDCAGDLVSAARVPYRSGGVQLDAWPGPRLRITTFDGTFRPTANTPTYETPDYYGPFYGFQVAFEGQHVGLGLGLTHVSGYDGLNGPSIYLRGGNIDGAHFRADLFPPTTVLGSTGWLRAGVGFGDGHVRATSGFVGIALPPAYNQKAMLTGSIRVSIAQHLAVQMDGIVGPGEQYSQRGAALALRYDFGAPSR